METFRIGENGWFIGELSELDGSEILLLMKSEVGILQPLDIMYERSYSGPTLAVKFSRSGSFLAGCKSAISF